MAHHDDPPAALLRPIYALASWGGVAVLLVALVALVWILFSRTSSGTVRSQELAALRPTVTAIAARYADGGTAPAVAVDLPGTCAACHMIAGTAAQAKVGPDLTHIGSVAAERIASTDYTGAAADPEAYIRESIVDPSAYVVPGPGHGQPGASVMPAAVGNALSPRELDQLVAYLASLE